MIVLKLSEHSGLFITNIQHSNKYVYIMVLTSHSSKNMEFNEFSRTFKDLLQKNMDFVLHCQQVTVLAIGNQLL